MRNIDNIAKAVVVLSSAYLLPPRHAALYIAGSVAMLYTGIFDIVEDSIRPPINKLFQKLSDGIIYKNARLLPKTITQCALFYCATALFEQPLNEFLNLKGINGTASQFIVSGAIQTIVSTLSNTDQSRPFLLKPSTINICMKGVAIPAFLYFTGFDKNYPMVFVTTSIALVLLEKLFKWPKGLLPLIASESLTQLCVDKMGVDLVNPILSAAKSHANITANEIINMVP